MVKHNLALNGDFIPFHRVGNDAREFHYGKNYFFLSSSFHAKSAVLLTWRSNKCAWHPSETLTETGLKPPMRP